jgi:hypothetical protein
VHVPAELWDQPVPSGPRVLPKLAVAQAPWSALGPRGIGNRWSSVGTSGHGRQVRIAGHGAVTAPTSYGEAGWFWVRIPSPGFRGYVTDLALPGWPSRRLVAALWAVERLSTSHSGPLKLPSTGTADQNLDFRLPRWNGSGTGRPRFWVQLPSEVVRPLLQVRRRPRMWWTLRQVLALLSSKARAIA